MTKEIPLTQGKVALVDDEDYERLSKYKWCISKDGNIFYAIRRTPMIDGKRSKIWMHISVINTPKGMQTDHINGNGLDNRRENLRVVTARQNAQNRHISKTSKYPGVAWNKPARKWVAQINISGKIFYLGVYDDEEKAAIAYRDACKDPTKAVAIIESNRKNRERLKSSRFLGVCWNKQKKQWLSRVWFNGKRHHLGYYDDEELAALRYRIACEWQVMEL